MKKYWKFKFRGESIEGKSWTNTLKKITNTKAICKSISDFGGKNVLVWVKMLQVRWDEKRKLENLEEKPKFFGREKDVIKIKMFWKLWVDKDSGIRIENKHKLKKCTWELDKLMCKGNTNIEIGVLE